MDTLQFALLGLGTGAVYILLANGLIFIYRGSGVINFAHGGYAMAGAYVYYDFYTHAWGVWWAVAAGVVTAALLGALTYQLILRRLSNASPLARLIATLGVLTLLEGVATEQFGGQVIQVPSFLPTGALKINSELIVPANQIWMLGISLLLSLALFLINRFSLIGVATSAVAESERAASALGWSPNLIATVTWTGGAALAGLAGVLIVPLSGLTVDNLALIVVFAMAATVIGGFSSYFWASFAGLVIGIVQSVITGISPNSGWDDALPILVIICVLAVRGRVLPGREHLHSRLPAIGEGRIRLGVVCVLTVIVGVLLFVLPTTLTADVATQLAVAVILLSAVIITGYCGQLSLAPYAFGGVGALFAGTLISGWHWPFILAAPAGILCTAVGGFLVGLPALRTRGVNLAIVTLGLGLAVYEVVFSNVTITGGPGGISVGSVGLFGLDISPVEYPSRYALFCLLCFLVSAIAIANLRRGRAGRRLIAIRSNERASASLGIGVAQSKLAAFSLASAVAGLGGILLGFGAQTIIFSQFDPLTSIYAIAWITVGGIGFVTGSLIGSGLAAGAVGAYILDRFGTLDPWLGVIAGVTVLLMLLQNPGGAASAFPAMTRFLVRAKRKTISSKAYTSSMGERGDEQALTNRHSDGSEVDYKWLGSMVPSRLSRSPSRLAVKDLSVVFGGVAAVDGVDFHVDPGEIVGLVGPNGAGKTTLVDAVSGFVSARTGQVLLGNTQLDRMPAHKRARAGLVRSFQSVELFDDLSIRENLLVGHEDRDLKAFITDLVWPGRSTRTDIPDDALAALGLSQIELSRKPTELPQATCRLVSIVRALLASPSILLLDEPASGLDEAGRRQLYSLIRDTAKRRNIGVLLIEHDMGFVMNLCDRIIILAHGEKIADDEPAKIRENADVIAAYLGSGAVEKQHPTLDGGQ